MDAKEFADTVVNHVQDHHTSLMRMQGAAPVSGVDLGNFCSIWPSAKPALGMVLGFIAFIPGYGAIASGVLKALMTIGDNVASEICNQPAPPAGH